jgi:gluconolactonase
MSLVDLDGEVTSLPSTSALPAANGACMFQDQLLVCDQGFGQDQPSQLVLMKPSPPYTTTPVLNNFYGRPFNSLNDVIVVPTPGHEHSTIWFTDPAYGHEQGFKPAPQLPSQVYVFDPYSGGVRVVADGFVKPNGIVYDDKRKRAYVTDTGMIRGCGTINGAGPGTM